ncbi:tyrosine-type recombinase/integrase [Amycolatopsis coloradensis]|uniref:tyrosine-type recombinase/integrase n=1 Tax=Amycolatopsis coloradensis TaxID=76021 RepID=UPI001300EBDD|nr:tyrosine-type recombinase/integrase [Amycolatopsis coloradensis]
MDATGALVLRGASSGWEELEGRLIKETKEWLERLQAKSKDTARGYGRDLGYRLPVDHPHKGRARSPLLGGKSWWGWLRSRGVNPLEAPEIEVIRWVKALKDDGYSANSRGRALAAVRSWYAFLEDRGVVERSPAAKVSAAAQGIYLPPKSPTIVLAPEESAAMISTADHLAGPMRLRNSATVALLLVSGIRVGECCDLSLHNLVTRQGKHRLQFEGKGGRPRALELADLAAVRLLAYLESRPDLKVVVRRGQAGARDRIPLLMTRTGKRVSRFEIFRLLRRVAEAAGLPREIVEQITPHATRHSTADQALDAGANPEEIRLLLGHADLRTTQRYLHADGERVPHKVGRVLDAALAGTG